MCIHVSIGFNASHHVCTSTTTCMCKHIYYKVCLACMSTCTYIPSLPSILACVYMSIVNPSPMRCTGILAVTIHIACIGMSIHVNRQPKSYAVSTITWILAVTIHIACIGIDIHVSISFNPSERTSFMSNHLWTCTYMSAFVPSTFQLMYGYMSINNTTPCQK